MISRCFLVALCALLLVLVGVGTRVQGQEEPTPDVAAIQTQIADLQATLTAVASQGTPVAQTNTFEYGGFTFTFTDEKKVAYVEYGEEPRGIYVVVVFKLVNNANAPYDMPYYYDFLLKDGKGRTFTVSSSSFDVALSLDYDGYFDLQPGLEYESAVAFDVPKDATDFVLSLPDTPIQYEFSV